MSKFFVVANLKMNKSFNESVIYLESLIQNVTNYDDEIILCPSSISLEYFSKNIGKFKLGIQDVDQRDQGQGTGSISASQVRDLCTFSIVGHSERRIQFNETDEIIFQIPDIFLNYSLIPSWLHFWIDLGAFGEPFWGQNRRKFRPTCLSKPYLLQKRDAHENLVKPMVFQ